MTILELRRLRSLAALSCRRHNQDMLLGIDHDLRRGPESQSATFRTAAAAQIEDVSVPRTDEVTVLDRAIAEGAQPVRAFRRVRDELTIRFDDAIRMTG
jgi:hypothetical protein